MACTVWVKSDTYKGDGGYPRWSAGQSVKFLWYDGRDLSNSATYAVGTYDKVKSQAVTLAFDSTSSGALS